MTFESLPTPQPNRRAYIWRPGCKRLIPEKSRTNCNPASQQPSSFAFVAQGIINRNPKKH